MFKFNFDDGETESEIPDNVDNSDLSWKVSEEVMIDEFVDTKKKLSRKIKCDDIEFDVIDVSKLRDEAVVKSSCGNSDEEFLKNLESSHSDLIAAKYEGGFKIWECSYDLIRFLKSKNFDFMGKRVLDLGCGAGLLGIFALQKGAFVHFQDYNVEVLRHFTIQNVLLNCDSLANCRFFGGDWQSFSENHPALVYDYILSAETIYNAKNHVKLCSLFEKKLASGGVGFLAAKTFYFGVGGGTEGFKKVIKVKSKLACCTQWTFKDGLQREILKIEHKIGNEAHS